MNPKRISRLTLIGLLLLGLQGIAWGQASRLPNFTELVKNNRAAVVNISTTQTIDQSSSKQQAMPNLPKDSPFNQFFKHFFGNPPQSQGEEKVQSLGSGFIISSDGYILTNNHVVKNADSIIVQLSNHRELPAKLVGADERTDIALLKIKATDLPTVTIGDSDKLQVGQWVLAIGSPFGLQYSATQGIVSALGRSLPSDTYVPFIQTDAAVNPGNSGGPLFNTDGQVIGINAEIYSNTGGYMGLSFAIPINVAMNVAKQLKSQGYVTRGYLGVYIQPVTQDLAESFGLKRPVGALVSKVVPDSPAAHAGIKAGDVILKFDGKSVDESDHLPPMVAATPVGRTVTVVVQRNGHRKELHATIAKLPAKTASSPSAEHSESTLHITAADLSPAQREKLKLGKRGVLVKNVQDGAAADAGMRPGDVILTLDNKDVGSVQELSRIAKKLPRGRAVPVLVERNGHTIFLALKIPKNQ
ncbi:MAG TPA: DegQ family serine endoprotease [Gammaproteobacteria bacterium]|nr:DegQ family serine endoprotease [Gammaproteobacteria bacterium]